MVPFAKRLPIGLFFKYLISQTQFFLDQANSPGRTSDSVLNAVEALREA